MLFSGCHAAAVARPGCELADIVRLYSAEFRTHQRLSRQQLKVLRAIETCRTAVLGGHRDHCASCGFERYAYNSCRNRHCPKCQSLATAQWLEERQAELLPVPYFHNVFTLPHELNPLILCKEENQRALLQLLFKAASETLLEFGRNNLDALPGITMVLHTWDQQLRAHFHVHCLISGGGLSLDGQRWVHAHPRYLFPVKALGKVFRGKFLDSLRHLYDNGKLFLPARVPGVSPLARPECFYALLSKLRHKPWVVYSKAPFAGPAKMLAYLGRYTHRVALSNQRLLSCHGGLVRFHYRDRTDGDRRKIAELPADEFLRRFLRHVLPKGFCRIRHFGLLANRGKAEFLDRSRQLLGADTPERVVKKSAAEWILKISGIDVMCCPKCGQAALVRTEVPPLPQGWARHAATHEPAGRDTS
jgi:putative transposase/transposase-like zinc-binding protein